MWRRRRPRLARARPPARGRSPTCRRRRRRRGRRDRGWGAASVRYGGVFRRLGLLRAHQVLVHGGLGALAVAGANGLIDPPVQFRRLAPIARLLDGLAPLLVEERRHHLDDRREDRIAGGSGDGAMKTNIV